ncbi:hypothetical protein [Rhizobium leguminosarum]|uniref:hypothetical protein n=1 Tax=Rhizobium leguminosarum TaxID=384 RepID=UPI001FDF220A|nr:hypothetical protein [Rhizobium leguminosarum]
MIYLRLEHSVIVILMAVVAIVAFAAIWSLILKILLGLFFAGSFDRAGYSAFRAVYGMILKVITAF